MRNSVIGWVASVFVLAAVVAGFITVGSPSEQRARRYDQQRVYDLMTVQGHVQGYWTLNSALPVNLSDSLSGFSGSDIPRDPETGAEYEYEVTGDLSFRLCANFNHASENADLESRAAYPYQETTENWEHDAGRYCYEREVNPSVDRSPTAVPK